MTKDINKNSSIFDFNEHANRYLYNQLLALSKLQAPSQFTSTFLIITHPIKYTLEQKRLISFLQDISFFNYYIFSLISKKLTPDLDLTLTVKNTKDKIKYILLKDYKISYQNNLKFNLESFLIFLENIFD